MILDALTAETWRLLRNRSLVFVSLFLTPILFALGGVGFHWISKNRGDALAAQAGLPSLPSAPLNLGDAVIMGVDKGANGVLLVFMLIAAATVYAGDYRWETWRLITTRNSRPALILGKVGTMKLMAVAASLLFLAAAFVFHFAQAAIYDRALEFRFGAEDWGQAALLWLLGYIRIVQYGLIALLTAVLTRSLMAALFVPWALGFVQSILGSPAGRFIGLNPEEWPAQLLLPGLAYDSLKALVRPGVVSLPMEGLPPLWPAVIGLVLWTTVPLLLALVWFQRQDLSKE